MKKIVYLSICLLFLVACSKPVQQKKAIQPFTFTDQYEEGFGTDQLRGKMWIANFMFTNCKTVCRPMTSEMAALQSQFKKKGIEMEFVSFTVDPTFDKPAILQAYIHDFTDDFSNWHLLTGYSQEDIEVFARDQFQTIVQKPASSDQIIHGTNFYLVDSEGKLIGEYNYMDNSYVDVLVEDIKKIQK